MIVVDKNNFIAYAGGILFDRSGKHAVVGDDTLHDKAVDAMDAGETIALTVDDEIVSYMKLTERGYTEFLTLPGMIK